jgi:phosphatidylinositol-3-phosphatase
MIRWGMPVPAETNPHHRSGTGHLRPYLAAVAVLALVLAACSSAGSQRTELNPPTSQPSGAGTAPATGTGTAATTGAGKAGICGRAAKPPTTWAHVVWIWMENQDYPNVVGNSEAPYENASLIGGCGLATNYHNITHPSLPNYLAATSGAILVHSDCGPDSCPTPAPSLFAQLSAAGKSWRAYQESMPANCSHANGGDYAAKHNPPVYYTQVAADCARFDVPMGGTDSGNLAGDLRAGSLPNFSFITPNLCHDTHDCTVGTGDRWLADWVPRIIDSPAYRAGNTVLVVTWDEGNSGGGNDCATNTTLDGCHIPAIVVSPSTTPGTRSDVLFNHYSLLKTTEQLLGLPATLGQAADPATTSMRGAFNL